jgi:proteasome accessory factor A
VTRQIFAGAGKLGVEGEDQPGQPGVYQLAQRSDFFTVLCSIDTMNRRPIVNTRDEPHADAERYRRFHVIVGDSNMSEWATAMKIGTTSLVLDLIEHGHAPQLELADPIAATKQISRDPDYSWIIELRDGRKISALDVQRLYLAAAKQHCDPDEDTSWTLREWEMSLDDLTRDYWVCKDRIDWVAKKFLLETMRDAERLTWSDPWLQSIDLEYHNVGLDNGLSYELVREGRMRRMVSEEDVKQAIFQPPLTTRAFFRGRAVARFNREIASIQWDEMVFSENGRNRHVALGHPAHDARLEQVNAAMRDAQSYHDLLTRLPN